MIFVPLSDFGERYLLILLENILQSAGLGGIMGVMRGSCLGRGEGAVYEVFGAGKSHIAVLAGK